MGSTIRTFSHYQIDEINRINIIGILKMISREDETGDIMVEYLEYTEKGYDLKNERIKFNTNAQSKP